jgi:hypothetical protein
MSANDDKNKELLLEQIRARLVEQIRARLVELEEEQETLLEKKKDLKKQLRSTLEFLDSFTRENKFVVLEYEKNRRPYINPDESEDERKTRVEIIEYAYAYYTDKTEWNKKLANEDKADIKRQNDLIEEVHGEILLCVKQLKELK